MLLKKISTLLMIGGLFAVTTDANASLPVGGKFSVGLNASRLKAFHHKGRLVGINGSAGYHFQNRLFIDAQLRSSAGKVKKLDTTNADLRVLLGGHIPVDTCVTVSPFIGLGYNALSIKQNNTKVTVGLAYIPMGLMTTINMSKLHQLEFTAEYDLHTGGDLEQKTGNVRVSKDISSGKFHGFRGEAMYVNKFANQSALAFGPYVTSWQSKGGYRFQGKAIKYNEVGVKIAYRF